MALKNNTPVVFISAGEDSGDAIAAPLVGDLLSKGYHVEGIAGKEMREQGCKTVLPAEQLQVMGFFDVIWHLPRLYKAFYFILNHILHTSPDVVVLVDYPGFHLRLSKALKKRGFQGKIIQYVCPSVWAWKRHRIETIENNYDGLLSLFPFEPQYFSNAKIDVRFVGHPLYKGNISLHKQNKEKPLIGIFPGSRVKEIQRNLPVQLSILQNLHKNGYRFDVVISVANSRVKKVIDNINRDKIETFDKSAASKVLPQLNAAIAVSGTVTLELAFKKIPTVVIYVLSSFDYLLAKYLFKISLPFYAIVNILFEKQVFKEFIGTRKQVLKNHLEIEQALLKIMQPKESSSPYQVFFDELEEMYSSEDATKNCMSMIEGFLKAH